MYKINTQIIKEYIKEHNLTTKELSKICNLSYSTMLKIINGNSKCRFESYIKISQSLDIRISKLIHYVKNKK